MQVQGFSWPVYQQANKKLSSATQTLNFAKQNSPAQNLDRFECVSKPGKISVPQLYFGRTNALHNAVIAEDTYQITQCLLHKNRDYINEIDEYGCTPFLLAIREGKLKALRLFLESARGKVDYKATAPRWDTGDQIDAWELAELYGQTRAFQLLEEKMGIIKLPRLRRSSTSCSRESEG